MQLLNVCKDMPFSFWCSSLLFVVCTISCQADELTGLQTNAFPHGPFALPMSKDGCAEEISQGWSTGFINITTALPFDKLESYHRSCGAENLFGKLKSYTDKTYILGPFDKNTLQMNFCYKTADHQYNSNADWPLGMYGIYGTPEGCPSGFTELFITLCLPPMLHYDIDGFLPGLTIEEDNELAVIKITYCRRSTEFSGTEEHQSPLNSSFPFLLIKDPEMTSESCHSLTGYDVSEESFPIPLPAVLSNGNTSFRLTYCRYVPYLYGKEKHSWDVFPGTLSPFLDISLLVRSCDETVIGTYIERCGEVEVWVIIDAGRTLKVSGVMWYDDDKHKNTTRDLGHVSHIFIGNKLWSFIQHGALLCGHSRPETNQDLTGVAEVYMCDRRQLGRYITVVLRVGSWEDNNIFNEIMMYILSDDEQFGFRNTTTDALKLDQNWNAIFTGDVVPIDNPFTHVTSEGLQKRNSLFSWNITMLFTYVRLQFVYIHLRKPKEAASGVFLNNRRCKDSIFISSTVIKNPFVDAQDSQMLFHLDSRYNNRQPIFLPARYRGESIFLTFFVCSPNDFDAQDAGFRVYILDSSYPVCTERCTYPEMKLITDNFLGRFIVPNRQLFWTITTSVYDVKGILKIEDFDISCYSASEFYINAKRYCNQDVSLEEQYFTLSYRRYLQSLSTSIIVQYDRRIQIPEENNVFPEGFQLSYKLKKMYEEAMQFESFNSGVIGSKTSMEACSATLGKCYHFKHAYSKSWIDIAKMCKADNFLLVNIKSPEELKALRSMLEYFYKIFMIQNIIMDMDVFIGLSRYVDFSGRFKEQWTDGTVLTHEAWDVNQPSDIGIKECTMMNLVKPDGTFSWFTTPCNQVIERESIYVCEQDTKGQAHSESVVDFTDNWISKDITIRKDPAMLFQCSSGEWMSHMVRCNGLRECLDASDELNCPYSKASCDGNMFTCTEGKCIHFSQVCDHRIDCLDSSDEYCSFPKCNGENEFTCYSGQCIPMSQRCDSYTDCVDGSDEILCASCNPEKAFQCGDTSCISLRLMCDKINDCPDASDERSCDLKYETCDDFWRHGLTTAKEYVIGGNLHIKCSLDAVRNIMSMTLLNSDWKFDGERKFRVVIPNSLVAATNKGYFCHQSFFMESHRERTFMNLLENRHNDFIMAEYLQSKAGASKYYQRLEWMSVDFLEYPIEEENGTYRSGELYQTTTNFMVNGVTLTLNDNFTAFENRVVIGEVNCFKEFNETEQRVSCGRGVDAVSYEKLCMYSIDHNGVIDGCRSWNHLQNCGNFVCPWDHFKCVESYCVPYMYVCNGFIDCPNGEDESVCDCSNATPNIMGIIVFGSGFIQTARSDKLYEIAFRLGGSLYTEHRDVYVLKVNEGEGPFLISIDSTQILSRSERVTKVFQNHKILDGDNILQIVFGEKTNASVGLVVVSDDVDLNNAERYLTANLRNMTENASLQRIVIDSHIKEEAMPGQPSNGFEKEIIIQNSDVLGTLGTALFSDLCEDKTFTCRGHFRCRLSMVCIPVDQVCDGKMHCPYEDDEHYCNFECPEECRCGALIMNCSKAHINHTIEISQDTRVIDASYTNRIAVDILRNKTYTLTVLTTLNVSNCELEEIDHSSFQNLQNLITLDISFNRLKQLTRDNFISLPHLQYIFITGNRLLKTIEAGAFNRLLVKSLSISHTNIETLSKNTFAGLKLTKLDLSGNKLENIEDLAFNLLEVELMNIEDNKITEFSNRMFEGVENLVYLKTSSFKFCCVKPPYLSEESCYPPKDEFSSCEHLMRNITLKALLWAIGSLALIGNILSILYRLIYDRPRLKLGYGVFVTNLGISDLLMGIYLLIIAIADKIFEGSYIEFDERWRQSGWCQFAGMLSTLSSEASVLFMVFITLDRLLIIKYPFGDFLFKTRTAVICSIGCWLTAFTIAVLPILLRENFDNFYGKSAVCLALPLTGDRPPGWLYSILIFIGFNMVTFLLIGFGQWLMYKEIKRTTNVFKQQRKNAARANDLKITRNLLLLVSTDFMCWFPIGLMGFLSLAGHEIPGVVYSWAAVLILPINSALNPFLYTFMSIVSKKNFTPRLTEQRTVEDKQDGSKICISHIRLEQSPYGCDIGFWDSNMNTKPVSGESVLGVTHFTCMNAKWSVRNSFTLTEILQEQNLSLDEIAFIVYNVIKYLASLEECGLTLPTISERQILLQLDEDKHVRRKIFFIGKPVLCKKKTDQAESISTFGNFLDKVISSNSRD